MPVWDQVEFFLRPREWYQQFHGQMQRGKNYGALASLTPSAALVDAYLRPDGSEWQPDADDLDIPNECKRELESAWKQAGLDEPTLKDLLSWTRDPQVVPRQGIATGPSGRSEGQ